MTRHCGRSLTDSRPWLRKKRRKNSGAQLDVHGRGVTTDLAARLEYGDPVRLAEVVGGCQAGNARSDNCYVQLRISSRACVCVRTSLE